MHLSAVRLFLFTYSLPIRLFFIGWALICQASIAHATSTYKQNARTRLVKYIKSADERPQTLMIYRRGEATNAMENLIHHFDNKIKPSWQASRSLMQKRGGYLFGGVYRGIAKDKQEAAKWGAAEQQLAEEQNGLRTGDQWKADVFELQRLAQQVKGPEAQGSFVKFAIAYGEYVRNLEPSSSEKKLVDEESALLKTIGKANADWPEATHYNETVVPELKQIVDGFYAGDISHAEAISRVNKLEATVGNAARGLYLAQTVGKELNRLAVVRTERANSKVDAEGNPYPTHAAFTAAKEGIYLAAGYKTREDLARYRKNLKAKNIGLYRRLMNAMLKAAGGVPLDQLQMAPIDFRDFDLLEPANTRADGKYFLPRFYAQRTADFIRMGGGDESVTDQFENDNLARAGKIDQSGMITPIWTESSIVGIDAVTGHFVTPGEDEATFYPATTFIYGQFNEDIGSLANWQKDVHEVFHALFYGGQRNVAGALWDALIGQAPTSTAQIEFAPIVGAKLYAGHDAEYLRQTARDPDGTLIPAEVAYAIANYAPVREFRNMMGYLLPRAEYADRLWNIEYKEGGPTYLEQVPGLYRQVWSEFGHHIPVVDDVDLGWSAIGGSLHFYQGYPYDAYVLSEHGSTFWLPTFYQELEQQSGMDTVHDNAAVMPLLATMLFEPGANGLEEPFPTHVEELTGQRLDNPSAYTAAVQPAVEQHISAISKKSASEQ